MTNTLSVFWGHPDRLEEANTTWIICITGVSFDIHYINDNNNKNSHHKSGFKLPLDKPDRVVVWAVLWCFARRLLLYDLELHWVWLELGNRKAQQRSCFYDLQYFKVLFFNLFLRNLTISLINEGFTLILLKCADIIWMRFFNPFLQYMCLARSPIQPSAT